ncbi:ABC transporter substrate-binding protein [Natronolimnobius sp. AArcel1]|uniref:ABC transporter substrate-binding protein n=1 Tax=Natronolimnobius sp. AArcel1 TaxID=1679093 RepID=UPI0013EAEBA6|nr:ABC transporter substrate-binding protein [Natronolimnobius sp. AArcel1]NGM67744.1 ABC transporter substrate-binding protein [Natronolimnobius sp. AArcel1]
MVADNNGNGDWLTRRMALKSGAIGGAAMLAGCMGGGDDGNGNGDGGPSGELVQERVEKSFTKSLHRGTYGMDNASWNPFDPSNEMADFDPPGLIYDPPLVHYQSHDTFQGVIANNWEDEDDSILVELNDNWTWHDGDSVTVHDWITDLDIWFAISEITSPDDNPSTYIGDYEAVDDYTIRFHLRDDFTMESVLINEIANGPLIIKEDVGSPSFGEWRDDLVDVDPESDEATELVSDFQEWSPEIDEVVGNGPFELVEVTDTSFVTEVYDDHPNADNIYFEEYVIEHHEDQVLAFMEGAVDAIGLNLPDSPDVMEQLPDHHEINRDFDHLWSILFNFGDYSWSDSPASDPTNQPITADENVRKAIAYALDRDQIATSVPSEYELYELPPTFLNQTAVDEGLVDIDGYDNYDTDLERATELMEEAGYELDDDMWYDEDGEPAELELLAQSGTSVQVDALDSVQYQLNEFGFDANLNAVDEATYGESRFNGDHDLLFDNHPVFSIMGMTFVDFVWDWFSQLNHIDYGDEEWEVSDEIGNPDASGTMSINVLDEIEQLHLTGDDEYVQRLTWWYNQALPMYGIVIAGDYGAIQADEWHVDGPDELLDNRVAEFNLTKIPDGELIPYKE